MEPNRGFTFPPDENYGAMARMGNDIEGSQLGIQRNIYQTQYYPQQHMPPQSQYPQTLIVPQQTQYAPQFPPVQQVSIMQFPQFVSLLITSNPEILKLFRNDPALFQDRALKLYSQYQENTRKQNNETINYMTSAQPPNFITNNITQGSIMPMPIVHNVQQISPQPQHTPTHTSVPQIKAIADSLAELNVPKSEVYAKPEPPPPKPLRVKKPRPIKEKIEPMFFCLRGYETDFSEDDTDFWDEYV